jgi:hypothetical protein
MTLIGVRAKYAVSTTTGGKIVDMMAAGFDLVRSGGDETVVMAYEDERALQFGPSWFADAIPVLDEDSAAVCRLPPRNCCRC